MKRNRFVIPACVVGGLAALCLLVWGGLFWFGSPLIPGSLERRYAREVAAHGEELSAFAQSCLEAGQVPEDLPLPGLVQEVSLWPVGEGAFVEFACHGWGLAPASSYYGFYYSPQGPQAYQSAKEMSLTEDGEGWSWQGEGDNHGYTQEIGQDFYYYEAHF